MAQLDRMVRFFADIDWETDHHENNTWASVTTPGGRFGILHRPPQDVPRLEVALNYPSPLAVEELAEAIEPAGGLMMEPLQETVWGGWGFSFNDPEGNNWEIGHPTTVTHADAAMSGRRPPLDGPIVALAVLSRNR